MTKATEIVDGIVMPDGSLQIESKLELPTGRVRVTVESVTELPTDDPFWSLMQDIWAGQKARGHIPRSVEEVETEREQIRRDWEQRSQSLSSLQGSESEVAENER